MNILYLVETPGQFIELRRFAELLRGARSADQSFLVYDCQPVTAEIVGQLQALGARCLNMPSVRADDLRRGTLSVLPEVVRRILRSMRAMLRPAFLVASYRRLLRHQRTALVVVAEDNVGGRSRSLVAAAAKLNIPRLLLPYTFCNPDEPVAALGHLSSHKIRHPLQRLFAAFRPRWSYRGLLRLPLTEALAMELCGLAPKNPWVPVCGPAAIAAESPAMLKHYRALGCAEDEVMLTGAPVDMIFESALADRATRRSTLRQQHQLANRPILLCALPPDQLSTRSASSEFADYADLVAAWADALSAVSDKFSVLVRPHPRIANAALEPLRQRGIAIAHEDTAGLVPLCDLFVAALSATIRWAIACGQPAISYDVYRYHYADYDGLQGVISVDSAHAFRTVLAELAREPRRLAALACAQAQNAAEWGCLDGGSKERLLALVDRLVGAAPEAA
jgi:hypothetical protein